MSERATIVLTPKRAVAAIARDFTHYDPQIRLFAALWPLVFGADAYLMHSPPASTAWIKSGDGDRPEKVDLRTVGDRIVKQLQAGLPEPEPLARICRLVFQTPARVVHTMGSQGQAVIEIATGMEAFACRQCGRCCQQLEYRDGCSVGDYRRWQALGRTDILKWVGVVRRAGKVVACRIWVRPGTNDYASACPWLVPDNQSRRIRCAIHELRPTICRDYPGSRKHARLTGCRGFDGQEIEKRNA